MPFGKIRDLFDQHWTPSLLFGISGPSKDNVTGEFNPPRIRSNIPPGISQIKRKPGISHCRANLFYFGGIAHNTVIIDGEDSSEVWGGFRVARRARPFALKIVEKDDEIIVGCGHDGYRRLPGKPVHHRQWLLRKEELRVRDWIEGGFQNAVARYHFHPEMEVELTPAGAGKIKLPDGQEIPFRVLHGLGRLEDSTCHPEFNVSLANRCLSVAFSGAEAEVIFDASSFPD